MKLTLPMRDGSNQTVTARNLDPFAIHPDLYYQTIGPGISLTHIKSGRTVKTGLCCRGSAEALAERLRGLGLNWNFSVGRKRIKVTLPKRVRESFRKAKVLSIVVNWDCPIHGASQNSELATKDAANKKA